MKKVILNYDEQYGYLTDANNIQVGTYIGLTPCKGNLTVDELVRLKEGGFNSKEIVELVENGVLM